LAIIFSIDSNFFANKCLWGVYIVIHLQLIVKLKGTSRCYHQLKWTIKHKKLLILSVNGLLCYFPKCDVFQGNACVFGWNIDNSKVEIKVGADHFLSKAFKKFHITIWSCMRLWMS
jgi:hypothetical protein